MKVKRKNEIVCHVCGHNVCSGCGCCCNHSCENCSCPTAMAEVDILDNKNEIQIIPIIKL